MYNTDAPLYPETKTDEYFIYTSIKSSGFAGLNVRNGPYGALSSNEPSDGTVDYSADKDMDKDTFLSESKWISDHADEILNLALAAMVDQYWENREYVLECLIDENPDDVVPEISGPQDLKNLCGIVAIHIKDPDKSENHRFGIEFGCNWEEEHGAGVRFENLKVIKNGHASDAFSFR
ncbi:hypothetical protein MN086_00805 [Sulfurovum sp. XGS-02]|uniref:DUF6985 domain-containing protein n=1 Tax=Sulfurovum sp. XGS-02 TaxID=2925411 RepID=UPI00206BF55F|nr:hypothetical protein [Sulfurovum sp. XGS-02]UPT77697.1 hypothetical protein MN086_00805 [Sulfurovum sp. XGS-02]